MNIFSKGFELLFPTKKIYKNILTNPLSYWFSLISPLVEYDIVSLLKYRKNDVRSLLWSFKYTNDSRSIDIIKNILYEYLFAEINDCNLVSASAIMIIPIPNSRHRSRKHGFHQMKKLVSELVAMFEKDNIQVLSNDCLKYKKVIPQQSKIKNRKRRLKNMSGAFELKENTDLRRVICFVIDDITTTGATLHEAKRALKEGGAKEIHLVSISH